MAEELSAARLRIALSRLSRRLGPTAAAGTLTPAEVDALFAVERRGPVKLSDLAATTGLNPTMLSRLVARLEELRLLRRLSDESDRRVSRVEATGKGRRLLQKVRSERDDTLSRRVAQLGREEREALAAAVPVLEELAESLIGLGQRPGRQQ